MHCRQDGTRKPDIAVDLELPGTGPGLIWQREEIAIARVTRAVDEHVDLAKMIHGLIDEVGDSVLLTKVRGDHQDFGSGCLSDPLCCAV